MAQSSTRTELPTAYPPLRPGHAYVPRLPRELTSFVGREREVDEVRGLLTTTRLLTLTGVGGVGKTRLGLRVAGDVADPSTSPSRAGISATPTSGQAYPDGVCLVELAALADPALVPQAVASALGVREQPNRSLVDTLIDVLRPRTCVLLLDNCEHLVESCAALADTLLRASPGLTVLATSREPLGIAGETVWRVPPLGLPGALPGEALPGGAVAIAGYEAIRLFVERARASLPTFELDDQNAPAVAQICQRLDGIPLAIELAAARIRGLGPEDLAARLDDRFRLLTSGSRTALPRQQTLRAAVDWSYELLSEPERVLFRRLSVFAGGWTLDAAEAVCDGVTSCELRVASEGSHLSQLVTRNSVLEVLLQLVDRSLVLVEQQAAQAGRPSSVRYRLLETLRQYGAERLREAGEEPAVRVRHAAWCIALAEEAGSVLQGPRASERAARLEAEHDNLRAALGWSLIDGVADAGDVGQRLAGALWVFWWMHGHHTEGSRWLAAGLAIDQGDAGSGRHARARLLVGACVLAAMLGNAERSITLSEEALALLHPENDLFLASFATSALGASAELLGNYGQAAVHFEQSLALARAGRLTPIVGWQLGNLGRMALTRGDYDRATTLLEESLRLEEQSGDRHAASWALQYLGRVALGRGDYLRALARFEEGLAAARDVGDKLSIARSLGYLGRAARMQGDDAKAVGMLQESLGLCRDIGDRLGAAWALGNLGRLALTRKEYQRATALFEENLALCRDLDGRERRVIYALQHLGVVAAELGQPARAARLFGAADGLRQAARRPLSPRDRAEYDQQLEAVRRALGDGPFATAVAAGQALSIDQAIDYALTPPHPDETPPTPSDRPTLEAWPSPLSAREQEVAVLLTRGLSNRQIAEELVISERTADRHVANILTKLGVQNRAHVAAWVTARG